MADSADASSASSSPEPGFGKRLRRDAGALRAWTASKWRAWRHRRTGVRQTEALDDALRGLGRAAVDSEAARALDGHAAACSARDARAQAAEGEATAKASRIRATEALERADAEGRTRRSACKAAVDTAEDAVQAVERDARAALQALETLQATTGAPASELDTKRAQLASLGGGLEQAKAALARAEEEQDAEARRTAEARKPLDAALDRAKTELKTAVEAHATARERDAAAVLVLGKAAASASLETAELEGALTAVRRAEAAVTGSADAARAAAERARAAAAGAGRFAWKAGLVLVGVIVLIVALAGRDDTQPAKPDASTATAAVEPSPPRDTPEAPPPSLPSATAAAPSATPAPLPGPTLAPSKPVDETPPSPETLLTPAVRAAVLALPSMAERRAGDLVLQRPSGAPTATRVEPVAGGGWRLRVEAAVERRADPQAPFLRYLVFVDVLASAQGEPLQVRAVGELDPELEALLDD